MSTDTLLEIILKREDDFLKIKETLTRIGVASKKDKTLYQSCHILHKQNRYYIVHFKEMFMLDGRETNISDEDLGRRNTIATLLEDWGLLEIVDSDQAEFPTAPMNQIKILPHKEKSLWTLTPKYSLGKK
jgi:hypothetical protein